jgi:hypothetical protein
MRHGRSSLPSRTGPDDLLVERLAHAVQALEFVLPRRPVARHAVDRGERLRVVRGELRVDLRGRREQLARAGEVGTSVCTLRVKTG